MEFSFDRIACLNIRRSMHKEWLLTNGTGDYASGTVPYCPTRKYHGLLVANMHNPPGRHVLLSTTEDSIAGGGKEFFFCTRKHPNIFHPRGHEYLHDVCLHDWPVFTYRIGDLNITREIVLLRKKSTVILKYTITGSGQLPPLTLRVRPLLALRHFHTIARAEGREQPHVTAYHNGMCVAASQDLQVHVFTQDTATVQHSADWYYNVQYIVEEERGFPAEEDLFAPGFFELPISLGQALYVCASTESPEKVCATTRGSTLQELWKNETDRRRTLCSYTETLIGQLRRQGANFLVSREARNVKGTQELAEAPINVIAGYHWFDAWGRDTFIALPGLTFCAGRKTKGLRILESVTKSIKNGLVPNMFHEGDGPHAYNSIDASLWYIWSVQKLLDAMPGHEGWILEKLWEAIQEIIATYKGGVHANLFVDEDGLLHAGNEHTQLTWMDAHAYGKPVTPRHGYAVELNALWYNALAFADYLAQLFGDPSPMNDQQLLRLRKAFTQRFWVDSDGGYLADVWYPYGQDRSIRPNQILAVSLPYPIIDEDLQAHVVECVRNNLLTPYGLRTLSPAHQSYRNFYEGNPDERDSAYHQGTVWPWLLGHYTEALLRTAWDTDGAVRSLLDTIEPLFSVHLFDAGIGGISEIFDASPPHRPNGCINQAWSVSEVLRSLTMLKNAAPAVYAAWEETVLKKLQEPKGSQGR